MRLGNENVTILNGDFEEVKATMIKAFPTREDLIGGSIEAFGNEFIMLEQNAGLGWVQIFLNMLPYDTTGISCRLGGEDLSVSWTFEDALDN